MATPIDPNRLFRSARDIRLAVLLSALLMVAAIGAAPALASQSEEQQGAQLLRRLEAGKQSCRSVSNSQFELIGEYVMGQMMGSSSAHESMNQVMVSMVGKSGEQQAHTFMGQRFTGCARGTAPASFGTMMGMMGAGMMGGVYGSGRSGGGMMGGFGPSSHASDTGGWTNADTVIVILLGVVLAAVITAFVVLRSRPGSGASSGGTP